MIVIASSLSACSFVYGGLGDEGSLDPGDDAAIDTSSRDGSATLDLGIDARTDDDSFDASSDDTTVALDTLDARDAADAPEVKDATDAADVADAPDTAPPPLCSGDFDIVACYRFENDGFARQPHDESIYGNSGSTFTGTSFVPGVHGSAVSVNAGSTIKVPDSASLDVTKITMEVRFRPAALPTGTRAGLLDDNGQYGIFIMNGGKVHCSVANPGGSALDSPAVVAVVGKWTHVACTYDGVAIVMFVDGVAVTFAAGTGNVDGAPTDGIAIGMNSPSGDNFVGDLDDLRIWRRALSAPEICASYKSAIGATCP